MAEEVKKKRAQRVCAEWLETEMEKLFARAVALADEYWRQKEEMPKKEQGFLGVRVRRREVGFDITWFRARFRAGQKKPYLESLPRGQSRNQYAEGTFRKARAKPWAIEEAMRLEAEFGWIRAQVKRLHRIRRAIREYEQAAAGASEAE